MTRRNQLKQYLTALSEINDVMSAMKNLAFIEINKLTQYIQSHDLLINTIDSVGADFFQHAQHLRPQQPLPEPNIYILLGSERGLCSNFNDSLINYFLNIVPVAERSTKSVVAIGQKLSTKLTEHVPLSSCLPGPSVNEEISSVIVTLLENIKNIDTASNKNSIPGNWEILSHQYVDGNITIKQFNPLLQLSIMPTPNHPYEPVITLSAKDFLLKYYDEYLFSHFYHIFYHSMISENYARLRHIDHAQNKLAEKTQTISHRMNVLRQEEITQEIENILLSSEDICSNI